MKLNKETEKIRDVTKSLYDVCKVDIYKDFLKLFFTVKYLPIDTSRASKHSVKLTQVVCCKISVKWHK